jgi:hypothetical protein
MKDLLTTYKNMLSVAAKTFEDEYTNLKHFRKLLTFMGIDETLIYDTIEARLSEKIKTSPFNKLINTLAHNGAAARRIEPIADITQKFNTYADDYLLNQKIATILYNTLNNIVPVVPIKTAISPIFFLSATVTPDILAPVTPINNPVDNLNNIEEVTYTEPAVSILRKTLQIMQDSVFAVPTPLQTKLSRDSVFTEQLMSVLAVEIAIEHVDYVLNELITVGEQYHTPDVTFFDIIKASTSIKATNRGIGNIMIIPAIELDEHCIVYEQIQTATSDYNKNDQFLKYIGDYNGIAVYSTTLPVMKNKIIVLYKGVTNDGRHGVDAGYLYAPYELCKRSITVVNTDTFVPYQSFCSTVGSYKQANITDYVKVLNIK